MFFSKQHLHFAGIGGIGMSGIAEVLLNLGYTICGSDLKLSPTTDRLASSGATVYEGHDAANVGGRQGTGGQFRRGRNESGSPGSAAAADSGDPARRTAGRADAAEIRHRGGGQPRQDHHHFDDRDHPEFRGLDPTVVVGGKVAAMGGSNARVGKSEFLVVESDESDGSFLKLSPIFAIVTNIDREHLDHYAGIEDDPRGVHRVRQ